MAKLYFYYSAMNAGKSTVLLQSAYNYQERGMKVLLFTPLLDNRYKPGSIHSRIGLNEQATSFSQDFDFFNCVNEHSNIACILVDEAQFLTKKQVGELCKIVDELNIPVLAYGLRSDFKGEPFEGSLYLLVWADNLIEIKTVCHCGKKAIMNTRIDDKGNPIKQGEQIQIGGNESYISVCRKHFTKKFNAN